MRSYRKKFEEKPVLPIAELKFKNTIRSYLGHRSKTPSLQRLAQSSNEDGRSSSCGAGEFGRVAAKANIDK